MRMTGLSANWIILAALAVGVGLAAGHSIPLIAHKALQYAALGGRPPAIGPINKAALATPFAYTAQAVVIVGDSRVEMFEAAEFLGPGHINRGVRGDTLAAVTARLGPILESPATLVVVAAGINDLIAGRAPEDYAADAWRLGRMLCSANRPARLVAVLGVNRPMYWRSIALARADLGPPPEPAAVAAMNEALRKSVDGCPLVEWVDPWDGAINDDGEPLRHMTTDGLHLALPGMVRLAGAVRP